MKDTPDLTPTEPTDDELERAKRPEGTSRWPLFWAFACLLYGYLDVLSLMNGWLLDSIIYSILLSVSWVQLVNRRDTPPAIAVFAITLSATIYIVFVIARIIF